MNKFQVITEPDSEAAAAESGEYLNQILSINLKKPVLLMLSAGSALSLLNYVGKTALGENLTVSMLDERFTMDPKVNNFSKMQKTDFYQDALDSEVSFFGSLPRAGETKEELANRWQTNLQNWRTENPKGLIIASLGMGADGHTSGITPMADESTFNHLFSNHDWIKAYTAENQEYKERVTATLTFLKMIDIALALVCGNDKKPKLQEVIKKQGSVNTLPALAWHGIKEVRVFTDIK